MEWRTVFILVLCAALAVATWIVVKLEAKEVD